MSLLNRASNLIWAMEPHALHKAMQVVARINLNPDEARRIYQERQHRFDSDTEAAGFEAVQAQSGEKVGGTRRVRQRNGTAIIQVIGPIVRRADFFSEISGATSIESLAIDFNSVLNNDEIKSIVLYFDSPGGEVNGIHEFAQMVYESRGKKPLLAYAAGSCCSGAYWIATACDKIRADATAMIGSVGVIARILDTSAAEAQMGIKEICISSTDAPLKEFDPNDPACLTDLQANVDFLSNVFFETVARNRGVTVEKVKADYGKGSVLIGQAAVDVGMVDSLGSFEQGLMEITGNPDALLPVVDSSLESNANNTGGLHASDNTGGDEMTFEDVKAWFKGAGSDEKKKAQALLNETGEGESSQPAQSASAAAGTLPATPSPEVTALQQSLESLRASVLADKKASIKAEAEAFYTAQLQASRVIPAQQASVISDYITAATDDLLHPMEAGEDGKVTTRVEALKSRYSAMPSHKLTTEQIKSLNLKVLGNDESTDPLAEAESQATAYAESRNKSRNQSGLHAVN